MGKANDLAGQKFGRLLVVKQAEERKYGGIVWECLCDCGNTVFVTAQSLRKGETQSCGCIRKEQENIAGMRFNRLIALEPTDKRYRRCIVWKCQCDCGSMVYVAANRLRNNNVMSCGCLNLELSGERLKKVNTTHGERRTRLHKIWSSMKERCNNPNNPAYKHYGGRGIKVCEEWNDFLPFRDWAMSHGYDKDAPFGQCTIDRIDNDEGYSPDNCRWVDMTVQNNNKRNTKKNN